MNQDFRLMPEQASSIASEVDALYTFLLVVSGLLTVVIAGLIVFYAIKYRRGSPADRTVGTTHFFLLEVSWIVVPLILTMGMFLWGAKLYFVQTHPPQGALEIDCVAKQWMWKFQHPEGKAEINDLHLPLGHDIKVNLISEDVIHSLFIPAFRVKMDVLPNRYTVAWFRPTRVGQYHLFCAEYCGAKHSAMRGVVHVMEPRDYQAWLDNSLSQTTSSDTVVSLFARYRCDTCHLSGGLPGRGPSLENLFGSEVALSDGRKVIADEDYLRESILRPAAKVVVGFQPIMPPYEGQIGEQALLQIIAKIKSMSSSNSAAGKGGTNTDEPHKDETKTDETKNDETKK
jgi:cytochrome c oxidase subunit 2